MTEIRTHDSILADMQARAVSYEVLPYDRTGRRFFVKNGQHGAFPDQIVAMKRGDTPEAWSISLSGGGFVYSKSEGDFIWEPSASSRDDAFYADTRFSTALEAFVVGMEFVRGGPTDGIP